MDTCTSGNASKPSGLPRLSKLPKPRPAQAPAPPQQQPPPQPQPQPQPPRFANLAPPSLNPPNRAPRLAKRASTSSLTPPNKPTTRAPSAKPVASRTNLPAAPKPVAKTSTTVTTTSLSNRSLVKPQKRQVSAPPTKIQINGEDEEHIDQLTSLDSFRSASQQGFHSNALESPPLASPDEVYDPSESSEARGRDGSRPSLSHRTLESLQSIPLTPKERRRSSFFNPPESPMGPPPRPGSSLSSRNGSRSRPGTSDGTFPKPLGRSASPGKKIPATAQPTTRIASRLPSLGSGSSTRRSISGGLTSKLQEVRTASQRASPAKKPTTTQAMGTGPKLSSGTRPAATSRPRKPRPQLGEAFASPSWQETNDTKAAAPSAEPKQAVSNSSAALREQIAAAKAAARTQKEAAHDSPQESTAVEDGAPFEEDLHSDPFNQAPKDEKHILRNRINAARTDGRLNIAALGLKQIPDEVRSMYSSAAMEESKVNWAEVIDLVKFIAADNEFEVLEDAVFPDLSPDQLAADDQTEGNQFGGLTVLDLHNNSLVSLPMGLRRLERLTSLNLSHNKLDNDCADVISQIKTLKDLRLGHNNLSGAVPLKLCELSNLETLDLQNNRLLSLPEVLRDLVNIKVLNVSGNQLTALPMDALHTLPLVELDASNNALIASIFPLGSNVDGHPTLQVLNAANNSLAALCFTPFLNMPHLTSLNLTNNHLEALPDTTGWRELITLAVGDNKIAEFPVGFTGLQKLRNANFTSNEIRLLDPAIGMMDSLEFLILASNPLREKKFLTMSAADIKRDLRSRLAPEELAGVEEPTSPVTVIGDSDCPSSMWSLKNGRVLDLASEDLCDDLNDQLGSFLNSNEAIKIDLHSNHITCIPPALWMAQKLRVLDLSCNIMSSDYLSEELQLPELQELNLSKCRLASFEPLIAQLQAPNLTTLNVSANRLTGPLPALKETYPLLTTLFAYDNRISSISANTLRGLITVNLSSNDIAQLPAEVGLLWEEGLRSLEIGANAFRVPNYHVLGKGTEATLRWLRDRLPASQGAVRGEDEIA
ncbi:Leucine-rich repeat-containing 40 [Lecanosticta acicola]|uniref:Leucine-rich repeat-containing 40 n=1 Tax=Lecanosticta acicola TaxID=111012 RepID=A0AAI8YVC1_9PEZI|nr:Leucine-rich repeat-containing 40 [Lecanosticta acicola]